MTILLTEYVHFEVAFSITNICLSAGHRVILYIDKKIHNSFNEVYKGQLPNNLKIYPTENYLGSSEEIDWVLSLIKSEEIDVVFVLTLQNYFQQYYQFLKKNSVPVVLTIHNINTWLRPDSVSLNPKRLLKRFFRRLILPKVAVINVISETLKDYIINELHYKEKPVMWLPSLTLNSHLPGQINNYKKLRFVVPGSIDANRRNYDQLFTALEQLKPHFNHFEIILLGNLNYKVPTAITSKVKYTFDKVLNRKNYYTDHNKKIKKYITIIDHLKSQGLSIKYYTGYVSEKEFDSEMLSADYLLSPTQIATQYEGITEYYGKSKCSGNINDMVKYKKPLIVPQKLTIPNKLDSAVIAYKNLGEELKALLENKTFNEKLTQEAVLCASQFNPQELGANLEILKLLHK